MKRLQLGIWAWVLASCALLAPGTATAGEPAPNADETKSEEKPKQDKKEKKEKKAKKGNQKDKKPDPPAGDAPGPKGGTAGVL